MLNVLVDIFHGHTTDTVKLTLHEVNYDHISYRILSIKEKMTGELTGRKHAVWDTKHCSKG
jgi:hypothetical protein